MDSTDVTVTIPGAEDNKKVALQNGDLNMLGMQVRISDIIGEKIVDQFMATFTPEQMEAITRALFDEVFQKYDKRVYDEDSKEYKTIECTEFKTKIEVKYNNYSSRTKYEDTPIYSRAKATIIDKYSEMISQKVEEYLNSDEYKAMAEEIAKDIINYAVEGYKADVIKGIRERLVLPVVQPNYEAYVTENIAKTVSGEIMGMHNSYYHNDDNRGY